MNTFHVASHYASALKNFAEDMGYDSELEISLKSSDELSDRYDDVPKVICSISSFKLRKYGVMTDYGFVKLTDYGLDKDVVDKATPENYSGFTLLFYR